jgi:hypothetical protein
MGHRADCGPGAIVQIGWQISHSGSRMSNEPGSKRLMAQPAPENRDPAETSPATLDALRAEFTALLDHVAQLRAAVSAASERQRDIEALMLAFDERSERFAARLAAQPPAPETGLPAAAAPPEEAAFLEALGPEAAEPDPPAWLLDAEPEAVTPDEPDRVPTVSGVVSRLGRAGEPDAETDAPGAGPEGLSAVALLGAMVEQLAAAMPPPASTLAATGRPADMDVVWVDPNPADDRDFDPPADSDADDAPAAGEPSGASPDARPEPAAAPPQATVRPIMPELDLLTNFERMETVPYLPPDIGTAVIFGARPRAGAPAGLAETRFELPALPAAELAMPPADPADTEAAPGPATATTAQAGRPAPGAELDDLLFERTADADPDPASALLGPPWPEPAPQPPKPAAGDGPAADIPADATRERASGPQPRPAATAQPAAPPRQDPLAPLLAMSEAERIALFE